jgi:hypothetical protein
VAIGAAAILVAASLVLLPRAAPPEPSLSKVGPEASTATLLGMPQQPPATPEKAPPRVRLVTIKTDPTGSDIYEGPRLIGKSPAVWTDAADGEHELALRHDGYRDEKGKVMVGKDGEEFSFTLHRREPARRGARPDLRIKAER